MTGPIDGLLKQLEDFTDSLDPKNPGETLRKISAGLDNFASRLDRGKQVNKVLEERNRQIKKGWTLEHDVQHGPDHILGLLAQRTHKIYEPQQVEKALVQIAALALAGLEAMEAKK